MPTSNIYIFSLLLISSIVSFTTGHAPASIKYDESPEAQAALAFYKTQHPFLSVDAVIDTKRQLVNGNNYFFLLLCHPSVISDTGFPSHMFNGPGFFLVEIVVYVPGEWDTKVSKKVTRSKVGSVEKQFFIRPEMLEEDIAPLVYSEPHICNKGPEDESCHMLKDTDLVGFSTLELALEEFAESQDGTETKIWVPYQVHIVEFHTIASPEGTTKVAAVLDKLDASTGLSYDGFDMTLLLAGDIVEYEATDGWTFNIFTFVIIFIVLPCSVYLIYRLWWLKRRATSHESLNGPEFGTQAEMTQI